MKAMIAALAIKGAAGLTGLQQPRKRLTDKTMIDAAAKYMTRVLKGEISGSVDRAAGVDASTAARI